MNNTFKLHRIPQIFFGPGQIKQLPSMVISFGSPVIIIHSAHSLSDNFRQFIGIEFNRSGIELIEYLISGEPSPECIDSIVNQCRDKKIKAVIAIGGGSVIDAGKAVSAMLPLQDSIRNYLEIIGTKKHPGSKIPFIALPTTAGTGSEASANAVLSEIGVSGFKRSLRHENFVPDFAIIDPELTLSCPDNITAACGMDALTQLLESYVSPKSSIFSDSLIEKTLPLIKDNLISVSSSGRNDLKARSVMAYAAMISGISLANAGLGIVHGLASAIGGLFPIPHGVICGTLLVSATKLNINKLRSIKPSSIALEKYSHAGFLLSGKNNDSNLGCDLLINQLEYYSEKLCIPKLSDYGIRENDIDRIIKESSNKNNPIELDDKEIESLIKNNMAM